MSRRKVIMGLKRLEDQIRPLQARLGSVLDTRAPARRLPIPLISFLGKRLEYGDKDLPRDLKKEDGNPRPHSSY